MKSSPWPSNLGGCIVNFYAPHLKILLLLIFKKDKAKLYDTQQALECNAWYAQESAQLSLWRVSYIQNCTGIADRGMYRWADEANLIDTL
jgi:hypothetical protein